MTAGTWRDEAVMPSSAEVSGTDGEPRARLMVDSRCALGEAATWCARSGRLFWADIDGERLWVHDAARASSRSIAMPERLACIGLCREPRYLLLGLATRLARFDLETGTFETLAEVEAGLPTRLNDGRCDRQGRFVFGTKHDVDAPEALGGFYRLHADRTLERLPLPACAIANSIAFSPDGLTMYYCDSPARQIRACDYPSCANDRLFVQLDGAEGVPDGSAVDSAGGLWNAQWGGACVMRYAPDGRVTTRIDLPVTQPTCVAFGGPALRSLYVTSARVGLDEADPRTAAAGGVFVVAPGVSGIAEAVFGA